MAGIVIPYSITITTSSGSGSLTTTAANGFGAFQFGGHIDSLLVKSSLTGTMFNVLLKDPDGNVMYRKTNKTSEWIDNTIHLPVSGIWTIEIDNADPDDTFTVVMGFTEAKT